MSFEYAGEFGHIQVGYTVTREAINRALYGGPASLVSDSALLSTPVSLPVAVAAGAAAAVIKNPKVTRRFLSWFFT